MTREEFEKYWVDNYVQINYEDVKDEYEAFVREAEKHIFIDDYEAAGAISKNDFMDNLSETAMFTFQDTLTEVFYDKNPDLYETAFELYELSQMSDQKGENPAIKFHEEYNRLYKEFLLQLFEDMFEQGDSNKR